MSCRVLLLEGDPTFRNSIASFLIESGIEVDLVGEIAEARSRLAQSRYDLLFIDAAPGDGDGLDFADSLRAAEIGTPFVITAAQDSAAARARAEASEAVAFLPKPFGVSQLRGLIRSGAGTCKQSVGGRVLMYSHDTIGLGHMRRNANIAAHVLERARGASVLMMVGSPAGFVFDLPDGMDFVKLPSLVKDGRARWRPGSLRTGEERVRALRAGLLRQTVESFEPDVVLVDHVPTGVWGELIESLELLRDAPWRPHLMLGLRDILDAPEQTLRHWREDGALEAISGLYDEILIYGDRSVFDTAAAYKLDRLAPGRIRYCGYVAVDRPEEAFARPESGPAKIMVAGGGGRDAYPMMAACLTALARLPEARRPDATFVAGPLMDAGLRAELRRGVEGLGLTYADMLADYPARLAASDLLVCMGGYNSIMEALNLGLPTLVVPRLGPSAEQQTRARLFAERGLVEMMMPDALDPAALATRFAGLRRRSGPRQPLLRTVGATGAASRIFAALERGAAEPLRRIA